MIKFNKLKQHWPKFVIGLVVLVIGAALTRVAIWENNRAKSLAKEDRPIPQVVDVEHGVSDDRVTEVKPTVDGYRVAPDRPRFLSIDKIGVKNARIIEVGVRADGSLGTPYNIYDIGWYVHSGKPGQGGTLLLDGHNGGPTKIGVFKHLPSMQIGDTIEIERGDGTKYKYAVAETYIVPLAEADKHMGKMQESPTPGTESISIITCTGQWSQAKRTYLSRQFLRATLQK